MAPTANPEPATDPARRREASYHGMPADWLIRPEDFAAEFRQRVDLHRSRYLPDHPAEEWHYVRLMYDQLRLDQLTHRLIAAKDELATRAFEAWDDDRAVEVEELGGLLPGRPERVRPLLLKTKHGAAWMIARWRSLDRQVGRLEAITPTVASKALDLLGVPKDERDGALADRLGVEPERSDDPASARFEGPIALAAWRDLVAEQTADLDRRIDSYLAARDARARADATVGIGDQSPEIKALVREEARLVRYKANSERELRRLQRRDRQRDFLDDSPARRSPSLLDRPVRSLGDEDGGTFSDLDLDDDEADFHGLQAVPAPTPAGPTTAAPPAAGPAPAAGPSSSPTAPTNGSTGTTSDPMTPGQVWDRLSPETQARIRSVDAAWSASRLSTPDQPGSVDGRRSS